MVTDMGFYRRNLLLGKEYLSWQQAGMRNFQILILDDNLLQMLEIL